MKTTSVLASLAFAAILGGCGMISEQVTSEDTMLDKAETATGIIKSNLTLVKDSVHSSIDAVNFNVTDKQGNLYKCYFTSAIAVTSDALCTKISADGSEAGPTNCNPLLKAAGKCQ